MFLAVAPDKRDQTDAVINWVECPEADDRTRAAADNRALLHKVKGNAAFTEGQFSDAMDLWEEALEALGVVYLAAGGAIMPDSGPQAIKQKLDVRRYPWRAAAVLCANLAQAALRLIEDSTAKQLGKRRTRRSRTFGELMAYQAFMAAVHAVELDPSYDKALDPTAHTLQIKRSSTASTQATRALA